MTIVGYTTTWSITCNHHSDDSRAVIYNPTMFIILATGSVLLTKVWS